MNLRKIIKNKEVRALVENFFSLSLLKIVSTIVPFIAIPYLIKTLSFTNYGIIVFGLSIITYFINISVYGFRVAGARDVAINKEDKELLSQRVSSILSTQFFLLIISSILYLLCLLSFQKLKIQFSTYVLFIPFMWFEVLFPSWFFQGIQKMKYITLVTSFVKIFFTLSVFILIKSSSDYWLYPLITSTGSFLAFLFTIILIHYHGVKIKLILQYSVYREELKSNLALFLSNATPMLYNNTTQVVLGIFLPSSSLGVFDAIRKIPTIINIFIQVVSNTIFPFLSRREELFDRFKNYLIICLVLPIPLVLISYKLLFRLFYIPDIAPNFFILLIFMCGMLGIISSSVFGTNYLIVRRKERFVLKSTINSAIFGLIFSVPLIYFFNELGAAINIALSQLILGIGIYYYYRKHKKNDK